MDKKDTVIVVGVTEIDQWGNMLVTPEGGGEKIKIAKKRENLHNLFQQGRAILLHWETYMNKPYVSDAKLVEGELPPPQRPGKMLPEHETEIEKAKEAITPRPVSSPEIGLAYKEIGELYRAGFLDEQKPIDRKLIAKYKNWIVKTLGIDVLYKEG